MPFIKKDNNRQHSEEIQDIITRVPAWILRWGTSMFFALLLIILTLAAFIRYPDIVHASMMINSPDSPKPIIAKIQGKLVKLMVKENQEVKAGQALGYLESTANHDEVLKLLDELKIIQHQSESTDATFLNFPDNHFVLQLGEMQGYYQIFYDEYINYKAYAEYGFYAKQRAYLVKDLTDLSKQIKEVTSQKNVEQKDLELASDEFEMHKKLAQQRVETSAELRQQESKFLSKKLPLIQTRSSLITYSNNHSAKEKEILELDQQMLAEKAKFLQALNSIVSQLEDWKSKYVLTASQSGKLVFANIIQQNSVLNAGQDVFYINPGNEHFFGVMAIAQINMGKVKKGQNVLIKLRSYPFEEYGMLRGRLDHISEVPYRDSVFLSQVSFEGNYTDMKKAVHLKQGMVADAEIITQDATILQRLNRTFLKITSNE